MSAGPLYTVKDAGKVALVAGMLAAAVWVLIRLGVSSLWWGLLVAAGVVTAIVFLVALGRRDPEAALRRRVVGTVLIVGSVLIAKATLGLTIAGSGKVDVEQLNVVGRFTYGSEPAFDWGCLVGGVVLLLAALLVVAMAGRGSSDTKVPPREDHGQQGTAVEPPPAEVAPEVFHERVRLLLENRAFAEYTLKYFPEPGCLIGECRDDHGPHRVVVRCDDRSVEVTAPDLEAVVAYAGSLPPVPMDTQVWYTTPGQRGVAPELAPPRVKLRTESELVAELVHFEGYLHRLVERYKTDRLPYSRAPKTLAETFVPPRFSLHGGGEQAPGSQLRDYLDAWLEDPRPRQIALLADYGMGKTSFVRHYAAHLAERWLERRSGRIPILLSLTGQSPRNEPRLPGLVDSFAKRYGLSCKFGAIELLMKQGRLVFLIDAFDEMDLIGTRAMRLDHFTELWKLHVPGNKLLFSGRPTFFPNDEELHEALRIAKLAPERLVTSGYCERVTLARMHEEDIERSFERYFPPGEGRRHFEFVRGNQRLLELAQRPAMMHIIRDTIEELRAGRADLELREAALLRLYTRRWIERQTEGDGSGGPRRKLLVKDDTRARFSENLAVWMFEHGRSSVQSAELSELFMKWFPDDASGVAGGATAGSKAPVPPHILDGIQTDLQNCTFLIRRPDGGYEFAHKPFSEYFVAASIDRCLHEKRSLPPELRTGSWGAEIAVHAGDLWALRLDGREPSDEDAHAVFRAITQSNLYRRAIDGARGGQGDPRFRRWMRLPARTLRRMIWGADPLRINGLQVLLRGGVPLRWIERRLFSRILRRLGLGGHWVDDLRSLDLSRACLDHMHLRDLDLSDRSLIGTSFVGATLDRCRFVRSNLTEARFIGSTLRDVSFVATRLHGAYFTKATLRRCVLDRADASGARFDAATFVEGRMQFTSLRRATLGDATFGADVLGVDAIDAEGQGVFTAEAKVSSKLPGSPPPASALIPAVLGEIRSASWSPDDSLLLVVSRGSVWLLGAGDGAVVQRHHESGSPALAAAFRPNSHLVVVTSAGTVHIHTLSGTEHAWKATKNLERVALSQRGTSLAGVLRLRSESARCSVVVADCGVEPRKPSWSADVPVPVEALAVANDGSFFIAVVPSGALVVFQDERRMAITAHRPALALHPDDSRFALAGEHEIAVYDVHTSARVQAVEGPEKPRREVHPMISLKAEGRVAAFSPDGRWLVGTRAGALVLWSCETWKEAREISLPYLEDPVVACPHAIDELLVYYPTRLLVVDNGPDPVPYVELQLAPEETTQLDARFLDDDTLRTVGLMTARLWDLRELSPRAVEERPAAAEHRPYASSIGVGPGRLALRCVKRLNDQVVTRLEIHDVDRDAKLAELDHDASLACFRHDGAAVAFESGDAVTVYDLMQQRELARVVVGAVSALAFSRDGAVLFVGDHQGWLWAYDAATGEPRGSANAPGQITAIAAAGDDRVLFASADGRIHAWKLGADLPELFAGPLSVATRLAVSPSGHRIAAVSRDDIVRVWDLPGGDFVARLYHLDDGWAAVRGDGRYRYGGDVSRLASPKGLIGYRLQDLDLLLPGQRLASSK